MVRPPLRSRSLICSQICPSERPSQAIDNGARCHSGCPGTCAGSKFADPWHVLQGSVKAPCPSVSGASYIYREQQQRYLPIKFSVRDRDLGSTIQEAQRAIAEHIQLPTGSRLEWVGEFANLQDAIARLKVVVPITLALIGLLLWINFGSMPDTLLGMSVVPMAVIGGVFGLFITQIPFSVSAAIGFIALFGISVMNGILILTEHNRLIDEGVPRTDAILRTGEAQMRPVLMTCLIAGVGLLPAAISTGIGSQVQKPLAIVVVGGMALAPLIILLTLPVLITLFSRRHRHVSAGEVMPSAPRQHRSHVVDTCRAGCRCRRQRRDCSQ
jgi:heavy metal efflux system protein